MQRLDAGKRKSKKTKRRRGFALSDHADWSGLLNAVKATGAEKVFRNTWFPGYVQQVFK
jgi:hypothetical protein